MYRLITCTYKVIAECSLHYVEAELTEFNVVTFAQRQIPLIRFLRHFTLDFGSNQRQNQSKEKGEGGIGSRSVRKGFSTRKKKQNTNSFRGTFACAWPV